MKRKKFSNEETKEFARAVKHYAVLRGVPVNIVHDRLKKKFGYKSYCWLWKRKKEILDFVKQQIRTEEYNRYS